MTDLESQKLRQEEDRRALQALTDALVYRTDPSLPQESVVPYAEKAVRDGLRRWSLQVEDIDAAPLLEKRTVMRIEEDF